MDRDRETNLRDRYTTAAQQLGDQNSAIREAGIHALAALVDDWFSHGAATQQREHSHSQARVCAHLLCSYLRANRHIQPGTNDFMAEEGSVRSSVLSVFRERIPAWRRIEEEWIKEKVIDERGGIAIDLSGAILSNANLANADLRHATLVGTNLSYANLSKARLDGGKLRHANLRSANLAATNMCRTDLGHADLSDAIALDTNFVRALAHMTIFDRTFLVSANFAAADLRGARFIEARHMTGESFTDETFYSDETTWPEGFVPAKAKKLSGTQWLLG